MPLELEGGHDSSGLEVVKSQRERRKVELLEVEMVRGVCFREIFCLKGG
jgi:hypothetical protein